jgi:hypothetical protein
LQHPTIRLWAVSKVKDLLGNYYGVSYAEDNADGDFRPARIDYTGNSGTGLIPYNSVRFTGSAVYAASADQIGQLVAPADGGWKSENGLLKYAAKYVPGAQAFSNLHDIHMGGLERLMGGGAVYQFINLATIPAYAYVQYQAFGYRSASYQYDLSLRREGN